MNQSKDEIGDSNSVTEDDSTTDESLDLSSVSGEEVWDSSVSSSDEDEATNVEHHEAQGMLYGISVFLNFFHLVFRLSERAMLTLLLFIQLLVKYISSVIGGHKTIDCFVQICPKSLFSIRKLIKTDYNLTKYAVCPKCNSLYSISECTQNGVLTSRLCDYVAFPNHKHLSRRTKCDTELMKQVCVGSKIKLVPRKLFVYHSIISCLQRFINRRGFLQKCELWRNQVIPRNMLSDILIDGYVWKDLIISMVMPRKVHH